MTTTDTPTCVNDWCDRPRDARGFCRPCYFRGKSAGDWTRATMRPREIIALKHQDIDNVAVARLVAGDIPERTTIGEREAAIKLLHAQGLSDPQIGARIGVTASCVFYRRKALGLPANPQQHSKTTP